MPNPYFQFKKFTVFHDQCAMKVTTDSCLFGAWCAREIKKTASIGKVLDIGTGSALLSLMIAQKNNLMIDGVEIESRAAKQATDNCNSSPFKNQIKIYTEDILKFTHGDYEYVVCNPPFYENEVRSFNVEKNSAHHSLLLKLDTLLSIINKKKKKAGLFYLLLPLKRKNEFDVLMKKEKLFANEIIFIRQSFKHPPFRMMIQGSAKNIEPFISELSIKNENDAYTQEFKDLLGDYYLYL